MQHGFIMVELSTMKVIMRARHSAARLPSAALLPWASGCLRIGPLCLFCVWGGVVTAEGL